MRSRAASVSRARGLIKGVNQGREEKETRKIERRGDFLFFSLSLFVAKDGAGPFRAVGAASEKEFRRRNDGMNWEKRKR